MAINAWLPIGFTAPDGEKTRRAIFEGQDWQIYESIGGGRLLVIKAELFKKWREAGLIEDAQSSSFQFDGEDLVEISSGADFILEPLESAPEGPSNKNEALSFAAALRATRAIDTESSLHDAIFIEKLSRILPTYSLSPKAPDDVVFGTWLTGGVQVSVKSFRRIHALTSWLGKQHLKEVIEAGGFSVSEVMPKEAKEDQNDAQEPDTDVDEQNSVKGPFTLPGRPELERFFNDHVVDIIENQDRYKPLGIEFPSAVILHGPPGCGKTFAVEKLVDYLGWPSYQVEASSVASPFIHETSKKIAEVFDQAIKNAPSVLVIDEMEAFLTDRQASVGSGQHKVEEVAEFLRRIPEAIKKRVLIVAMTNQIDMIDPAILRRGRFDHVIKVDMASESEILALLNKLLETLPCEQDVNPASLAKRLAGRPLSDVTFVIREGARLAARASKSKIDQACLDEALESSPARDEDGSSRKIGFI